MRIGPKYKIARRLGAAIFDKTQTPKFALREGRKEKTKFSRPKSDFGMQLLEKQKARMVYGVNEKQFANYVIKAMSPKGSKPADALLELLESRLDNAVYRIGFAPTRQASRQMVSHGHVTVNGKRVTIPSYHLSIGDKIAIRVASAKKGVFAGMEERSKNITVPAWLKFDFEKKEAHVQGVPRREGAELQFDLPMIIEFYSR